MPARLTSARDGCNQGNLAGDQSMSGKGPKDSHNHRGPHDQGKVCMVNAKLREPQTWVHEPTAVTHRWLTCHLAQEQIEMRAICLIGSPNSSLGGPVPAKAPTRLRGRISGRTGHLTTPYLVKHVNTGSPLWVGFTNPTWRRSRHISQMLGVMSETVTVTWADMRETDWATGMGNSAIRVKGGAFARTSSFTTTDKVR